EIITGTAECPYTTQTTTKANFVQWYRNTPNVNKAYLIYFFFQPNGPVYTFQSDFFFPLDGAGYGLSEPDKNKKMRNFHFTTEIHTQFVYKGGETFSFSGDDDVWVFINRKLAIDLGGLHHRVDSSVLLDAVATALGIEKGKSYPLDLFHAE